MLPIYRITPIDTARSELHVILQPSWINHHADTTRAKPFLPHNSDPRRNPCRKSSCRLNYSSHFPPSSRSKNISNCSRITVSQHFCGFHLLLKPSLPFLPISSSSNWLLLFFLPQLLIHVWFPYNVALHAEVCND